MESKLELITYQQDGLSVVYERKVFAHCYVEEDILTLVDLIHGTVVIEGWDKIQESLKYLRQMRSITSTGQSVILSGNSWILQFLYNSYKLWETDDYVFE